MVHIAHAHTVTSETSGGEVAIHINCDNGYEFPNGSRVKNGTGSQYWNVALEASQDGCQGETLTDAINIGARKQYSTVY